jgi:hypothetical protein
VPRVGILYITFGSRIFFNRFGGFLYWAPFISRLRQTRALIGGNISRIFFLRKFPGTQDPRLPNFSWGGPFFSWIYLYIFSADFKIACALFFTEGELQK